MIPVCARNNNPLNLRGGQPYEGLSTPAVVDGFCNFVSPVFGFRAAIRNYITKSDRGIDTVRKLISEWAPPDDNNDTEAYIASVCKATGFKPDEVIALKTWDVCSRVCYAQAEVESGAPFETYWKQSDMAEGAYRAGIVDAPPPASKRVLAKAAAVGGALSSGAGKAEPYISTALQQPHSQTVQIALIVVGIALAVFGAFRSKG